jgi:hypothetical protein
VQKSIAHLTFVRANLGFQFVGDQTTGALGLRPLRVAIPKSS